MGRLSGTGLLLVSAFCVYGFVAAGEPGVSSGWRVGYVVAGTLSLVSAVLLLARRRARTRRS